MMYGSATRFGNSEIRYSVEVEYEEAFHENKVEMIPRFDRI